MTNKTGLNGRKKVLIVLDTLRRGGIEIAALRFCRLLKSDDVRSLCARAKIWTNR